MKINRFAIPLFLIVLLGTMACAQEWDYHGHGGKNRERLDEFRKMKLIEVLGLTEDESVHFFAKQTAHEKTIRDLMKTRNDALDKIHELESKKAGADEYSKPVSDVLATDGSLYKERERYQDELKTFLAPDKFAKYLLFERNFGRNLRDAMGTMYKDRRHNGNSKDGDGDDGQK